MDAKAAPSIVGEAVRHTPARAKALCEILAPGRTREDVDVNVFSPVKIPMSYRFVDVTLALYIVIVFIIIYYPYYYCQNYHYYHHHNR